jgi:hypothetical protein
VKRYNSVYDGVYTKPNEMVEEPNGDWVRWEDVKHVLNQWITDRRPTEQILTRIYTAGYERGHHDTVESTYLHIHPEDVGTYFSDDVKELMQELPAMPEMGTELEAINAELLEASEAIVARWDSPLWKDQPHTGVFIDQLRAAIAKAKGEQP